MLRYVLAGSMVVMAAAPAFADSQFFIIQGSNGQCAVQEVDADDGGPMVGFPTLEQARDAASDSCDFDD